MRVRSRCFVGYFGVLQSQIFYVMSDNETIEAGAFEASSFMLNPPSKSYSLTATAPTVAFFKKLPNDPTGKFAIYVLNTTRRMKSV